MVVVLNPLITFIIAIEPINVAASMSELGQTLALVGLADAVRSSAQKKWPRIATGLFSPSTRRMVSHRLQPSIVAAEYGSPPEAAGMPAPGSAFMSSLGRWPPLDRRRLCG